MNKKSFSKPIKVRKIRIIAIPLLIAIIISVFVFANIFNSTTVQAKDLMKGITPSKVDDVKISSEFVDSMGEFSIELFKKSITPGKNSLISPLSVYMALAMTANGAEGNTLEEFEHVLGRYNLTLNDINKYCRSYQNYLKDVKDIKLNIVNSIWYTDDDSLTVNKEFLKNNADYYNANVYKSDFSSKQTVKDINNWVKYNTNGLIDKIVDSINPNTVMYLINALYFEGKWLEPYNKSDVGSGEFKLDDGEVISTKFMYSGESIYLEDEMAYGFIKPYKGDKYSFAALLPKEGIEVEEYILNLTGDKFLSLIKNRNEAAVSAALPKFKTEYSTKLLEPIKAMGINECFDEQSANFIKMGKCSLGNLFISDVLHKTFIQVDELGTKAGAVTKVEMANSSAPLEIKNVILDRPFLYALIDNDTGLPLFIGTMHDPR